MRRPDAGALFQLAWDVGGVVPPALVRGALVLGADVAWARRGGGVRQLERNLDRVAPGQSPRELRRMSHRAMRSYMRYYAEAFTLRRASREQLVARVRFVDDGGLIGVRDAGGSAVAALSHMGNWDLAGAWAGVALMPVLSVAERLKPDRLFREFLEFRESVGMRILALGDDGVFPELIRTAERGGTFVCLLADRDLTARGIEVELAGRTARVAAGPAALAVASGAPLFPVSIRYERLRGARRRVARTPWGIVVTIHEEVEIDRSLPRKQQVAVATQGWVTTLGRAIAAHPWDWHMLQKVFVEDLDADRYAQTRQEAGE